MVESKDDYNPILSKLIGDRVAETADLRITFADYMDLVLYHPQQGYYNTKAVNLGSQGDFFTSPHLGPDFGELLAEQFAQMWEILGKPELFYLVEMGAGQGILAADILHYLENNHPSFFDSIEYIIIEKAPRLIAQQKHKLQKWINNWGRIYWRDLDEISTNSIVGCCFSNELIDAFPVHQFVIEAGELKEIYVTISQANKQRDYPYPQFIEVTAKPSTPALGEYFKLVGIDLPSGKYPDGYRSEINLAALDWIKLIADKLHRGYLLTIDYGYPAVRYYSQGRSQGTLQCYYRHTHHSNPYIYIGYQDITAHVDFTALERWGDRCGLQLEGFTQQGLFLMALGISDRLTALSSDSVSSSRNINYILQRRDALHQLIDPMGLGGFGVLIQSKGISDRQSSALKGLSLQ